MRAISISDAVWQAIAGLGKFGETEDDVLRRVFNLAPATDDGRPRSSTQLPRPSDVVVAASPRRSFATDKLSSYISGNELRVSFASGPSNSWKLPAKGDRAAIRIVRDQATSFAEKHGATLGQVNAVKKTLTDSGFHLLR